jgi:hypothetical protein
VEGDREGEMQAVHIEGLFHGTASYCQSRRRLKKSVRLLWPTSYYAHSAIFTQANIIKIFPAIGLILAKASAGATLRVNRLQKFLVARPPVDLDAQFPGDAIGDLRSHGAAKGGIETVAALKERFNQLQFILGDEADIVSGRSGVHLRVQERPRGFDGFLVHHHGPGHEIAKAFVLLAE